MADAFEKPRREFRQEPQDGGDSGAEKGQSLVVMDENDTERQHAARPQAAPSAKMNPARKPFAELINRPFSLAKLSAAVHSVYGPLDNRINRSGVDSSR